MFGFLAVGLATSTPAPTPKIRPAGLGTSIVGLGGPTTGAADITRQPPPSQNAV